MSLPTHQERLMRQQRKIRQWPASWFARSSARPEGAPDPERQAAVRRWLQLAFTVLLAAVAVVYLVAALRGYSFGGASDPGPALFPVVVFGLLLLCSLIGIAALLRGRETEPPPDREEALVAQAGPAGQEPAAGQGAEPAPRSSAVRMLSVIVIAIVYCALLPTVGDLITGFAVCCVVATAARSRSWMLTLAAAVVLAFGIHELFVSVLAVPLPTGPWSI